MRKVFKKRNLIIIILLIIGFVVFMLKKSSGSNNNLQVIKETVKESNLVLKYDVQGLVESKKIVKVFSNNIALVKKVYFREGDEVKKGDVLADLEENITDGEVSLKKSKLNYENLKKEYENSQKLYKLGAISKNELDNINLRYENSKIDLSLAESRYKKFDKKIKSPISGIVIETKIDDNYTIDNRTDLFTIEDTENLQLTLEVSNSMLKNIKKGDLVKISSESLNDGVILEGYVENISKSSFKSKFSNDSITKITVKLDDYSTLKSGDQVEASIIYKNIENKIIIPVQYIVYSDNIPTVYVLENSVVQKREVKLGESNGIKYEILSGLEKDDIMIYNFNNIYKVGDIIK